jgi:hypothetical protein
MVMGSISGSLVEEKSVLDPSLNFVWRITAHSFLVITGFLIHKDLQGMAGSVCRKLIGLMWWLKYLLAKSLSLKALLAVQTSPLPKKQDI